MRGIVLQNKQDSSKNDETKFLKTSVIVILAILVLLAGFALWVGYNIASFNGGWKPEFAAYPITRSGPIEEDQNYNIVENSGDVKPMFYLNASDTKYYLVHSNGEFYNESDLINEALRLGLQDWVIPSQRAGIDFNITGMPYQGGYSCWNKETNVVSTLSLHIIYVEKIETG